MIDIATLGFLFVLLASGWILLARICRHGDLRACQTGLLFCTIGMAVGLTVDALNGRLALLEGLCLSSHPAPLKLLSLHWQQLPAMHDGMLLGSLITLAVPPTRVGPRPARHAWLDAWTRSALCCAFMSAGMILSTLAHYAAGPGTASAATVLLVMTVGMTWGTVLAAASLPLTRRISAISLPARGRPC